jgi:hypothetical protein
VHEECPFSSLRPVKHGRPPPGSGLN